MCRAVIATFLLLVAAPAVADEPRGCDKFAWNIGKAQQLLAVAKPSTSDVNDRDAGLAVAVRLVPLGQAKLKQAPERPPKDPASFAGALEFGPGKAEATYAVTLSAGAWIDVIQDGKYLKPVAFTGALDCPHVRKSVKFAIGPEPFTLQLSSAPSPSIDLVITPAN